MTNKIARDPELQQLIDNQEIRDLLMRYSRAVDRLDKELLKTVYSDDAWDNHGMFDGPASDFIEWVMQYQSEHMDNSVHSLQNIYIEFDGSDLAFGETYFTGFHRFYDKDDLFTRLSCGRYIDRFERRSDGWKIVNRLVVNDWGRVDPLNNPVVPIITGSRSQADPVYTRLPRRTVYDWTGA